MKERLINQDGSYNYTSFTLGDDVWHVIGTRSKAINHKDPFLAEDTLKSDKGEYREKSRALLFNMSIDGKIKPVLSSAIKAQKTYAKKDWDKLTGRVQ